MVPLNDNLLLPPSNVDPELFDQNFLKPDPSDGHLYKVLDVKETSEESFFLNHGLPNMEALTPSKREQLIDTVLSNLPKFEAVCFFS
jgi:hypothetical protein